MKKKPKNSCIAHEIRQLARENKCLRLENEWLRTKLQDQQLGHNDQPKMQKYTSAYKIDRYMKKPSNEILLGILATRMVGDIKRELLVETHEYANGDIKYTAELEICRRYPDEFYRNI